LDFQIHSHGQRFSRAIGASGDYEQSEAKIFLLQSARVIFTSPSLALIAALIVCFAINVSLMERLSNEE
jgi:ATP/ADP translocase